MFMSFFNEKISLIEAFDVCINNTHDHSDLKDKGYLYLSEYEKKSAKQYVKEEKIKKKKKVCCNDTTLRFGS